MSLGTTLKAAREARGLTSADIAEHTHIFVQTVESIERDDFSRIPAAVYGRGFIKRYAEFVGIEWQDLVDEFQQKYDELHARRSAGHFSPVHSTPLPPPPPPPPPPPVPAPEPEKVQAPVAGPLEVPPAVPLIEPVSPAAAPESEPSALETLPGGVPAEDPVTSGLPLFAEPPPVRPSVAEVQPPSAETRTQPLKPKSTVPARPLVPPRRARPGAFSGAWKASSDYAPGADANNSANARQAAVSKKIADGMVEMAKRAQELPPWVWRGAIVFAVALLLVWGMVKGCNALKSLANGETDGAKDVRQSELQPAETAAAPTAAPPAPSASETAQPLPFDKAEMPLKSTGDVFPGLYND